jgi:DNA invertase Pin-like site-specific DNA recombinase
MRVAIYVRVSTDDQDVGLQLKDLRTFAKIRVMDLHAEYQDAGVSGSKKSRPALDRLMADARKRKFDAVLVWRFDRFARSSAHLAVALDEFRSLGIQFISYQENIDTSTPMGQAMFSIIAAMAQLERDIIKERVVAGIRNAQAKGVHCGRPAQAMDPAPIRALRAQGLSIRDIAAQLDVTKGTVERALKVSA